MNEERLAEIETRIAFQEQTITDLSDVIYKQQQEIDRLYSTCASLAKQIIKSDGLGQGIDAPANEKPPHY